MVLKPKPYRPLLISCLLRRVLMVVKLKPWFSLFCFFGLLGSPITEAGEFWWSYNQSRVPCRIFKILSFRSRTCAVNLTDLSSFLPFPFPFEFNGNNRNQDCSPGCLASPCCLHALCIVVWWTSGSSWLLGCQRTFWGRVLNYPVRSESLSLLAGVCLVKKRV